MLNTFSLTPADHPPLGSPGVDQVLLESQSLLSFQHVISRNCNTPVSGTLSIHCDSMSLKRPSASQGGNDEKRAKSTGSKPLDSWLSISLPKPPALWARSDPLTDEDSTFLAWASAAESPQDIERLRNYVLEVANRDLRPDPPSHTAHGAVSRFSLYPFPTI